LGGPHAAICGYFTPRGNQQWFYVITQVADGGYQGPKFQKALEKALPESYQAAFSSLKDQVWTTGCWLMSSDCAKIRSASSRLGSNSEVSEHGARQLGEEAFDEIEPGAMLRDEGKFEATFGQGVAALVFRSGVRSSPAEHSLINLR
jgi:hypothetical protein